MENFKREIFEKLGNLFYALAADQKVSMMESGELKMLLRRDFLTERAHDSGEKVSEAAHLIGLTIDSLQNENVDAGVAFGNFAAFYEKHREQFSYALKQNILETSEAIVKIFADGEQENIHLQQLKRLLGAKERTKVG